MRAWAPLALFLLAASPQGQPPGPVAGQAPGVAQGEPAPGLLERLRYNVRERTTKARAELEGGDFDAAARSLETAHRLAPDSPTALYNLGTGHLHALDPRAIAELESLLETAPEPLVADTAYNLGNARLAANDFQGAIEAYKDALRADSSYADAKYNLELALERLEQEQQQQQTGESQSDSDSGGEDNESGEEESPDQQPDEEDDSGEGDRENDESDGEPDPDESDGEDAQEPLPQFEEQPEMTAEQAAAILEAVDNLERRQRQEDARDKARPVPVGGKDW